MNKVIIECCECGKYFEVSQADIERYNEVRALGYPSIMLDCRLCNQRTYWAVLSEVYSSWDSIPNKKEYGVWLPENLTLTIGEYLELFPLNRSDIFIGDESISLYDRTTAQTEVCFSDQKTLNIFQVRLIESMYQDFKEAVSLETTGIANTSIVIGVGDGVYLIASDKDPSKSLYLYYDDGCTLRKTSKKLKDVWRKVKK